MGAAAAFLAAGGLSFLLIFERQGRLPAARGVPYLCLRLVIDGFVGVLAFLVVGGAAGGLTLEIVRGLAAGVGFEAIARNRTPPFDRLPYELIMRRLDNKVYAYGASRGVEELNRYVASIPQLAPEISDQYSEWLDFNVGIPDEERTSILRELVPFVRPDDDDAELAEVADTSENERRKKAVIRQILRNGHSEFLDQLLSE